MATQMQLDIFLAGNRMATRSFREKKKRKQRQSQVFFKVILISTFT